MKGSRKRKLCGAALLALLVPASGCSYLKARWRDFTDIASAGIGPGGGLGARVEATKLIALEVIAQKDERFAGWRSRNYRWTESGYGILFASWRMPSIDEEPAPERRWYDLFTTSRRVTRYAGRAELEDERHTFFILSRAKGVKPMDALNVEVGVSAVAVGLEFSIRPLEIADFLLGWFGVDIAGDDDIPYGRVVAPPPPPPEEAGVKR